MTTEHNQTPVFEARHIGGSWDIAMCIPHAQPGAGATVESIIAIKENCGVAPDEAVIAQRVTALLNMSTHIDTEDLCIKGATLKLQTFSEAIAPASMTDRESDLIDTCEALRRSLRIIGNKFGVKLGADSDMLARQIMEEHEKLQARMSQADYSLTEHSEAISQLREHFMIPTSSGPEAVATAVKARADESTHIVSDHTKTVNELRAIFGAPEATPSSLMTLTRNAKENADLLNQASCDRGDALHTLNAIREALEVDPDYEYAELPRFAAELFESIGRAREANVETSGQLALVDNELATVRGERDMAHRALKDISEAVDARAANPGSLAGIVTERMNRLTSIQSEQLTMKPFKIEVMQLCMIEPSSPSMLPSLPELLVGIRDYVNTLTRYRGGAMILHDRACKLTGTEFQATDAEPYANVPWQVIADRLEEKFYAPRNAIATLLGTFELEVKDDYRDNVSELYSFLKGLTVAQYKTDTKLQTLLRERNADRAIIGAIDDLCGDVANRPTVPVMAAVRALVQSHINAIYAKDKTHG